MQADVKEQCAPHATTMTCAGGNVEKPSRAPTTSVDGGVKEPMCGDDVEEWRVPGQ